MRSSNAIMEGSLFFVKKMFSEQKKASRTRFWKRKGAEPFYSLWERKGSYN